MTGRLNEVAWTSAALAQAKDEGMTEAEITALEQLLSLHPQSGDLIIGSGGCRKVRVARTGGGKSGGYRVVTFYAPPAMPVYVIAMLAKGSRANFSKAEVAAMAVFARRLKART